MLKSLQLWQFCMTQVGHRNFRARKQRNITKVGLAKHKVVESTAPPNVKETATVALNWHSLPQVASYVHRSAHGITPGPEIRDMPEYPRIGLNYAICTLYGIAPLTAWSDAPIAQRWRSAGACGSDLSRFCGRQVQNLHAIRQPSVYG